MFCCCREDLDVADNPDSAQNKSSDKEPDFSEAVTTHPVAHQPASAAASAPVQASAASNKQNPVGQAVVQSSQKSPVTEDTLSSTAAKSVNSQPTAKPDAGTTNIGISEGKNKTSSTVPDTVMASASVDNIILSEIESLSAKVEKAAAAGELKGRESCRAFANQFSVLTSQVQKKAGSMSEAALHTAVSRLECVAARLESLALRTGTSTAAGDSGEVAAFVTAFDNLLGGSLAQFLSLSAAIGGDVKTQAEFVEGAFKAEREFLAVASRSKQPTQDNLIKLVQPVAVKLSAAQEYREQNRRSDFFNHLSAISESIAALGWITVSPTPGPYVKEMKDAGMFYTNRVLKDYKEKDKKHVDWVKAWMDTLTELQEYIKQHHTTGVSWNPRGGDASVSAAPVSSPPAGGAPPPPPPGPPPPPPPASLSGAHEADDSRAALIAALSKGEGVTAGLKKVSDDMKTHKNPGLRQGPAPFKAAPKSVTAPKSQTESKEKPAAKPPLTELQNKKWVVEYHHGNKNIVLDQTELKQTVYIYKCLDCLIQVKGKVNSIILDSCQKTGLVVDDLVSSMEFVNCQRMQGQVTGKVPTISIDKTDGCMIYLSNNSLNTEIVTAKSSEMNVLIPVGDGDYKEFAIPEQFKTTWNGSTIVTVQTDSI